MFYKERCNLCGECLERCPYLAYPRERAREEFRRLVEGKPTPVTSECITCVACNTFCPSGANPFDLINERQEETGGFPATERAVGAMVMAAQMPSQVVEGKRGMPVLNLCSVDFIPGVVEGRLFDGLTVTKGGEYFCYIGWIHLGKPSMVRRNARRFVENLAKVAGSVGASEVVCYHDDCYVMLTVKAKEYGLHVPFKPVHIIEYLLDYVRRHEDEVEKLGMKVAYQQPCASRYTLWKDRLLDELFERIGVERVKRKYDRVNALCCGGPMTGMSTVPREKVEEWKMRNVLDAKESGAEAMVFLCPLCALNLRSRAKAHGIEPFMLSNLVRLALGEKLTHGGAGKT